MRYRVLGNTGLIVSEICLGAMTYGGKGFWGTVGNLGQEEVNIQIKTAVESGINFFDTANVYSFGESEKLLGQSFIDTGIARDNVVIATKVRGAMDKGVNQGGLSRVHIMNEVDASLKRLQTDYIDLYQIHGIDTLTPLEETLSALNDLVRNGKVRYIGVSNHFAWQIMKALGISAKNNWARFESIQAYYSIAGRDLEKEIIPLANDQKVGILVWSPLAGGFLSGKFTRNNQNPEDARRSSFDFPPVDKELAYNIVDVMEKISKEHNVSVAQVALAWLLHKSAVTSVIIGAKKQQQLTDNIAATELKLNEAEINELDEISKQAPDYPGWMAERQSSERAKIVS
jgi:aryl-alcohol dehydrogenase-like predicted oxidoreductase